MSIKKTILKIANQKDTFSTQDIVKALKGAYTRAYILRFINELIHSGELVKSGSTRSATYARSGKEQFLADVFEKRYPNKNLKEHEILEEFLKACPFIAPLLEHIQSIFTYAFSEMVNNAIDHSKSSYIVVKVQKTGHLIRFTVDDFGIGVFLNVMNERKLKSELEAIQDLLKGKTTTMPHAHSGEGIFFTSKVADTFMLQSYDYELKIDNNIDDIFINELKPKKKGTRVIFEIDERHKGHLNDVFKAFYTDPEELAFDKTEIRVKLYALGSIYISRSQARRIISNLEKFRSIILDFDKVPGVGQAFADEIFRVFQKKHPEIKITPINMNEAVQFMVERVGK